MTDLNDRSILITGANSGLGYEAAAQLADAGYARIILACRTVEKAERARSSLIERVGRDPYESLAVDVSSIASAEAAVAELERRGEKVNDLLLNAGMVAGEELRKSNDGLELAFASSVIGHHVMAVKLIESGLVPEGGRVILTGSEAANNDLPAMMDMKHYDFTSGAPREFGTDLYGAMMAFARGEKPELYRSGRYYAVTKTFSAWWAGAMQRRYGDLVSTFTVSPGASLKTNMARHVTGFKRFLFTRVMPAIGPMVGMHQPVAVAAGRYVDVLLDGEGKFPPGRTYTSRPRKLVGPLQAVEYPHILDEERQEVAWRVLGELTGTRGRQLGLRAAS